MSHHLCVIPPYDDDANACIHYNICYNNPPSFTHLFSITQQICPKSTTNPQDQIKILPKRKSEIKSAKKTIMPFAIYFFVGLKNIKRENGINRNFQA